MSNDSRSDPHVLTNAQIHFLRVVQTTCNIPGVIACGLILIAYIIIAFPLKAKKFLNRVSLRLLIYALFFNFLMGIGSIIPTKTITLCKAQYFIFSLSSVCARSFITCIAINLQLVLVHGVNSKAMEKFYVMGTLKCGLFISILTLIFRRPVLNKANDICVYDLSPGWLMGAQLLWGFLLLVTEALCSGIVLIWLYRSRRSIHTLMNSPNPQSNTEKNNVAKTGTLQQTISSQSQVWSEDPRYQRIALRIAVYPIVSLSITTTITALELTTSPADVNKIAADSILYGIRIFAYGILAAVDPSFINAIQEIRRSKKQSSAIASQVLSRLEFTPGRMASSTVHSHTTTHESNGLEGDLESRPIESTEDDPEPSEEEKKRVINEEAFRHLERQL